ncbi:hypothetical protein [Umezakia ovalisporum]|uniref:Uncharacterized protein n=1 Tax=Umezakia ovalisporum FSS-43 TaxID=2740520 RepID=A0ABT6K542_9CYAN|nr:hypothetical protein [Umezakia ovalisporum]MBI1242682.1 hypothetical protein [Nostoc sp. RI_552]MDH6057484.1 hypothetical protein [Umezakia ovalisporum FSS-43]MDH6069563.1 hypothetical protein [Umezakia ovalisporum CobakiLakeA]MDH6074864.1 hypothetical protein [Umezakia ovalisporum CS-1034]MDH6083212.1 hypothetical protein [Umezakia ovalisporum FSS-44]
MLKNITKFLTARKLTLPMIGLLLTLGVVSEQIKPVLTNQIQTAFTSTTINPDFSQSNKTPLLSRLRQVQEQRSLIHKIKANRPIRNHTEESEITTLNTDYGSIEQHSRFVSSDKLLENINLTPETTSLVSSNSRFSRANLPKKDGTYLYGQSSQASQIGQRYVLFEKRQSRITGVLYMPESDFSCFQGAINQSGELVMTVSASPGEVGVDKLATVNQLQIPNYNDDQMSSYPYSVALQDYHEINSISARDLRILEVCKEVYKSVN